MLLFSQYIVSELKDYLNHLLVKHNHLIMNNMFPRFCMLLSSSLELHTFLFPATLVFFDFVVLLSSSVNGMPNFSRNSAQSVLLPFILRLSRIVPSFMSYVLMSNKKSPRLIFLVILTLQLLSPLSRQQSGIS